MEKHCWRQVLNESCFLQPISRFSHLRLKAKVKWEAKRCNLFCNIAAKPVEKANLYLLPPRLNLSSNKSGCCKLLEY